MTVPAAASKTNVDTGTDTPAAGRQDIEDHIDKFNTMRSHLLTSAITSGTNVLGVGNGLQSSGGNLVAQANGTTLNVSASGIRIADDVILPGTGAVTLPDGTTAQRPGVPVNGMLRYNTTTNKLEVYENGAWKDAAGGSDWSEISGSPFTPNADPFAFTSVFTNAAKDYLIRFEDAHFTSDEDIRLRIKTGAGTISTSVYSDAFRDNVAGLNTDFSLGLVDNTAARGLRGDMIVRKPGDTDDPKTITGVLSYRQQTAGNERTGLRGGTIHEAAAMTGFELRSAAGSNTWDTGSRVRVYER